MGAAATPEPPAAAVARDPHWAAKVARMRARKPLQRSVTLLDDDAHEEKNEAAFALSVVEARVREEARKAHSGDGLSEVDLALKLAEVVDQDAEVVEARARLAAADALVEECDVPWVFRGLPGDVFEALVSAHPPTKEQDEAGQSYNAATFAPALIQASCIEDISDEDIAAIWAPLTQGERSLLFQTAVSVNQGARAQLGKG